MEDKNKKEEIKKINPRAFPLETDMDVSRGMTLRDYFAAKAINQMPWSVAKDNFNECAKACYKIADALLKARENGG